MTAATIAEIPADLGAEPTPLRVFLPGAATARFEAIARARDALARGRLHALAGYSVKTNPRAELLEMAAAHDLFAEVISPEELTWAREQGFGPDRVIYNGPHALRGGAAAAFAFADSLEAFERYARDTVARTVGVRLRPAAIDSRFGVALEDDPDLARLVAACGPASIGVSFHARRGDFAGAAWRDVAGGVLERAAELERRSRCRIVAFDVGGGWRPEEFDATFLVDVGPFAERVAATLPACETLIFEPGQAICTPAEAIVTTVLEVRARRGRREAIVDAGYADWSQMHAYIHAVHAHRDGRWTALPNGPDRLAGRTCLEYDRVDGFRLPDDLAVGERIVIAGTGSYDASMAFDFGRGRTSMTAL